MGKMEDSNMLSWFCGSCILGVLASIFIPFVYIHIWIIIAIIAIAGGIAIFIGKTKELNWVDVGLPSGAVIGLMVGGFIKMLLLKL